MSIRALSIRSHLCVTLLSLVLGCSGGTSTAREPATASEGIAEREATPPSEPEPAAAGEASAGAGTVEPAPSEPTASEPTPSEPTPSEPAQPTPPPAGWFAQPRQSAHIFASGHSLIDHVFGPMEVDGGPITALARRTGKDHHSVFQGGPGSPARVRREDIERGRYAAPEWRPFDVLVLTERADPHNCIIWERTSEEFGWFVDRVRGAGGELDEVFVYQTWWGFGDPNPPNLSTWPAWAAFVREELPLHECVAQQVARSRRVPTRVLPTGIALAELMVAIDAGRIPGLTAYDIFNRDNVHLVELGNRFLALVVYASVYRTPTRGIPMAGIPEAQAAAMQEIVDRVVGDYYARTPRHSLDECRQTLELMCQRHGGGCMRYLEQGFPAGSI